MCRFTAVLLLSATAVVAAAALPVATLASGERCIAGHVVIKLDKVLRGRVRTFERTGQVGVAELDELNRSWGVTAWRPALRGPHPSPAALNVGADLVYLVEFPVANEIDAVCDAFRVCPFVDHACPDVLLDIDRGTDEIPDDSLYPEQWHLPHIGAPAAWDYAHGDSGVIVVVLDDGLRWTHPDIEPNLWINGPEDLNDNGRFDPYNWPEGDYDGIDQDGNGYADDVIGWNFQYGEPNPYPDGSDNHGTQCLGIANAVTDNRIGVAAPPWNVRTMAIRCGSGGGISLYAVIAAIYFAVPKGADVLSMSFGGSSPYQPLADACAFAAASGCLLCASAGNDGGEYVRYPACHDGVLAVASSGRTDWRSFFSNYGPWIAVSAPGEDLLTTSGDSGYACMSGASAATPLVAGVLAWIRSAFPGLPADSVKQVLFDWCDSMPDPLYLQGKLGHGRVRMPDSGIVAVADESHGSLRRQSCTVVRGVLLLSGKTHGVLVDAGGRRVAALRPGRNDVAEVPPGVYFVLSNEGRSSGRVVVAR